MNTCAVINGICPIFFAYLRPHLQYNVFSLANVGTGTYSIFHKKEFVIFRKSIPCLSII